MKKHQSGWIFILLFLIGSAVSAEPINSLYHWEGFYLGVTTGAAFTNFDTTTSTKAGSLLNSIQTSAVNQLGNQKIKTTGFLSGIEGGYNWSRRHLLIGFETDIQSLSNYGETNSGAIVFQIILEDNLL